MKDVRDLGWMAWGVCCGFGMHNGDHPYYFLASGLSVIGLACLAFRWIDRRGSRAAN